MSESTTYGDIQQLAWSTTELCDAYMDKPESGLQVLRWNMTSYGARRWYSGQIQTASADGAGVFVKDIVSEPGAGRILVIDGHANDLHAILGDRLALIAASNGWEGMILNGYVRDVMQLKRASLGIHALGVRPNRATVPVKAEPGTSFQMGNVNISPGIWGYVDEDGIIFMSRPHSSVD